MLSMRALAANATLLQPLRFILDNGPHNAYRWVADSQPPCRTAHCTARQKHLEGRGCIFGNISRQNRGILHQCEAAQGIAAPAGRS
jgi:hypothetical protein